MQSCFLSKFCFAAINILNIWIIPNIASKNNQNSSMKLAMLRSLLSTICRNERENYSTLWEFVFVTSLAWTKLFIRLVRFVFTKDIFNN